MAQSDARARLLSQANFSYPENVVLDMFSGYRKGGQTFVIERMKPTITYWSYQPMTTLWKLLSPDAVAQVNLCVLWVGCQLSLLGGKRPIATTRCDRRRAIINSCASREALNPKPKNIKN